MPNELVQHTITYDFLCSLQHSYMMLSKHASPFSPGPLPTQKWKVKLSGDHSIAFALVVRHNLYPTPLQNEQCKGRCLSCSSFVSFGDARLFFSRVARTHDAASLDRLHIAASRGQQALVAGSWRVAVKHRERAEVGCYLLLRNISSF